MFKEKSLSFYRIQMHNHATINEKKKKGKNVTFSLELQFSEYPNRLGFQFFFISSMYVNCIILVTWWWFRVQTPHNVTFVGDQRSHWKVKWKSLGLINSPSNITFCPGVDMLTKRDMACGVLSSPKYMTYECFVHCLTQSMAVFWEMGNNLCHSLLSHHYTYYTLLVPI